MFKKVLAALAVLGVFYSAMGQNVEGVNARLDAMGGCGVIGDIGWTIGKPSSLYGYADQVQASALIIDIEGMGTTFGSIIAIKSIGEHFFVGATMNGRRAMSGSFYTKAITFGNFTENFGSMSQLGMFFPVYPEINFCLRPNDNLSIGLGGYFEYSKFNDDKTKNMVYNYENTNLDTVNNLMNYDSTVSRKYYGIGIVADARIWFGSFKINPEFKIFMPNLDGRIETNSNDNFDTTHNVTESMNVVSLDDHTVTTSLKNNLFLRVGAKFSNTFNETFWILGLWYKTERFEMTRTTNINGTILDYDIQNAYSSSTTDSTWLHNKTSYDWWLGCQPKFSDNLTICPEYSGFVMVSTKTPPPGATQDSTLIRVKHKFRLGMEMSVKGFWIFEEFLPRMGFNYYLTRDLYDNMNDDSSSENTYLPYSSNNDFDLADDGKGAKITAGFGLKGKRGTFDLSLDVLSWKTTGLSGPGAAIATFGLDFGRKKEE